LILILILSPLGGAAQSSAASESGGLFPDIWNSGGGVAADSSGSLPPGVSIGWWDAVREDIIRGEYYITRQEQTSLNGVKSVYQAPNRSQNLRTYFTSGGIRLTPRVFNGDIPPWEWGVTLASYGCSLSGLRPVDAPARTLAQENRFEYQYSNPAASITEWYINDERGLEQGFTLHAPPAGTGSQLILELNISGDLVPHISADGQTIEFRASRLER